MTLNEQVYPETHCIKVTKYTDWTYQLTKTEWAEDILKDFDFKPYVEEFKIPCRKTPEIVWETDHQFTIGIPAKVTIIAENDCGSGIFVGFNGKIETILYEGECESFEIEYLKTIEICCDGKIGDCIGMYEIEFNPFLFISLLYNAHVQCYISDCDGNICNTDKCPPIKCFEVKQKSGRPSLHLTLPDWNTVTLQKVIVQKQGYLLLKFIDKDLCIFTTKPFIFEGSDKVLLIAPKDTEVDCKVLEADCLVIRDDTEISEVSHSFEVKIAITLYQRILTVKKVIVEVEGHLCGPRYDI